MTRRSQAERTAETRARILAAVVESIADVGFPRTTANEIVRRAGVTWGAVQHHFGDKDGILMAVLEDSFDRFAARLADVRQDAPLERRVCGFVDRAWEHFASAHYRSMFEILLQSAGSDGPDQEPIWQSRMFRAWNHVWDGLFGDAGLPRRRSLMLQHYTIAALTGLASLRILEGGTGHPRQVELELLKATLARELARSAAPRTPRVRSPRAAETLDP